MGALVALASRVIASRLGLAVIGTAAALDIGPFGGNGGVDGRPRRRRRRRALTSGDKSDISFLVATLGPSAAVKLGAIILSRP